MNILGNHRTGRNQVGRLWKRFISTTSAIVFLAASPTIIASAAGTQPKLGSQWAASHGCVIPIAGTEGTSPVLRDKAGSGGQVLEVRANFHMDKILVKWTLEGLRESRGEAKRADLEIPVTGAVSGLAVADFTGDGQSDLAVADFLAGTVSVYRVERDTTITHVTTLRSASSPIALAAGDYDNDGNADIAIADFQTRRVITYGGLGDGRFRRGVIASAAPALASSRLFQPLASAAVDYTALKTAIGSYAMGTGTRAKLNKYTTQSENAYNGGNRRKAVSRLEKLIKWINYNRDSQLSETNRKSLIQLTKDLMAQILGAGGVSVTMTANPSTINQGGTSTLTWSSTGAASAVINQGVGSVATSGSTSVAPAGTTTYTIVVTAADGKTGTASATVNVGSADAIFVNMAAGSDTTGDGSSAKPYRSITKGLSVATSGKTVNVASGVYDTGIETMPLTVPDGVTLQGAGATNTIIMGGGNSPGGHAAVILGNNTILNGFKIRNTAGFGVWMDQTASISSCTIDGAGIDGVEVVGSANLTITGSTVTNSIYDGLWFQDSAQATVSSTTLQGNTYRGIAAYDTPGPISVTGNTLSGNGASGTGFTNGQVALAYVSNTTISGNSLTSTGYYAAYNGIYALGVSATTISGNSINMSHYNYGYGIRFTAGSNGTISGNSVSLGFRGIRVSDTGANPSVSGNSLTGQETGFRIASAAAGTYRSNIVTGCLNRGIRIGTGTSSTPDFGTAPSPGGNTFQNLATGCANYYDAQAGSVSALGNTWDNVVPTYTTSTAACPGFDIQNTSGGTVSY
ncbi:MAG: DUF1565 domain-containing protein [Acidobacteria bacterium]|nr:DUF1565 domain-containing protein [Acidobacteriota bacterium]